MNEGWFHLPTRETHSEYIQRAERVVDWIWSLLANRKEYDDTEGIILVSHEFQQDSKCTIRYLQRLQRFIHLKAPCLKECEI